MYDNSDPQTRTGVMFTTRLVAGLWNPWHRCIQTSEMQEESHQICMWHQMNIENGKQKAIIFQPFLDRVRTRYLSSMKVMQYSTSFCNPWLWLAIISIPMHPISRVWQGDLFRIKIHAQLINPFYSSWWLQHIWKYSSNWNHVLNFQGKNQQNLSKPPALPSIKNSSPLPTKPPVASSETTVFCTLVGPSSRRSKPKRFKGSLGGARHSSKSWGPWVVEKSDHPMVWTNLLAGF